MTDQPVWTVAMRTKISVLLLFTGALAAIYLAWAPYPTNPLSAINDDDVAGLQRMLEKGTSPNLILHENSRTPIPILHEAIYKGSERCIDLLLDYGADVRSENWAGNTPLMALIDSTKLSTAAQSRLMQRMLPESDLTHQSKSGETPLHLACRYSDLEIIMELISWGASPTTPNNRGVTPLELARQRAISESNEDLLRSIEDLADQKLTPSLQ